MRATFPAPSIVLFGLFATTVGCSERIEIVQLELGGTCLACHEGITDAHPSFALACADCHGGDDASELVRAAMASGTVNARDQELMRASHVLPLEPTDWFPNGIDDNRDGRVDDPGEFFDGRLVDDGVLAAKKQHDSEINTDLDYLRFLNPGDLRAAQVGCGSSNRNANEAMVCHSGVVYDVRRSLMANNPAVPAGALYGNAQLAKAADYGEAFASSDAGLRFDARNPRIGRVGYTYDYDAIDAAYLPQANAFDRLALLAKARENADPDDDDRMAFAGPLFDGRERRGGERDGRDPAAPAAGTTRFGNTLKFPDRAVEVLQPIGMNANRSWPERGSALEARLARLLALDDDAVAASGLVNAFDGRPLTNPVDAALRHFRPYQTLNVPGTNDNFGQVDFSTSPVVDDAPPPSVTDIELAQQNNPFGRGRPSGCTACHVAYRKDGHNEEPLDRTVADNGRQPSTALPFGIRTDKGERFYARRHEIKRTVEIETCASCHGFVTRVDLAYSGSHENEGDLTNKPENIVRLSPVEFTTPRGSRVRIVDNLARWKNGALVNEGERTSEDKNGNGELDPGEDVDGDSVLSLPDRDPRSESFDGRQPRVVYGGANGSTRLADVHFLAGLQCVDCHSEQDVHGDGNIYTRNWDAIEIECDDCHGTPDRRATLETSGPNGGTDMTAIRTAFGEPWLEASGDEVIQHSRTKKGVSWTVPQLTTPRDDASRYAHEQPLESAPDRPEEARRFAHIQESGKPGGLECYACHSSWQPNCLDCHVKMDVAKPVQEQWYSAREGEDVFFQLFSFVRSPFLLGRGGDVEGNKIGTWRATQEVFLTVTAGNETIADSVVFSTPGGLSSLSSNPYFPHTVRVAETKSCARCHTLVDDAGRIANDHMVAEAQAEGTGRYDLALDWAFLATSDGLELIDVKKEAVAGSRVQFPGFDHDATAPRSARFRLDGIEGGASDVAVLRGVSFANGSGDVTDVALVAHAGGLSVVDVFGRDAPTLPPFELARLGVAETGGPVLAVDVIDAAASQSTQALVLTTQELLVIDFRRALEKTRAIATVRDGGVQEDAIDVVGALALGVSQPTKVRVRGKHALVTHATGLSVIALDDGGSPVAIDAGAPLAEVASFETPAPALDVVVRGRFAFVAAGQAGVLVFDVGPLFYDLVDARRAGAGASGASEDGAAAPLDLDPIGVIGAGAVVPDARGLALWGSRLLVADGDNGLLVVDVAVPADPIIEERFDLPGARAVVVSATPVRTFALVLDDVGVRAVDLTPAVDQRARPDRDARGVRLSLEKQDPLTPFDARSAARTILTFPTSSPATAIARGVSLDRLQDGGGRPLRDSWSIGARSLEQSVLSRMRSVIVRELPGSVDVRGDGLGCVVRVGDDAVLDGDGRCLPRTAK